MVGAAGISAGPATAQQRPLCRDCCELSSSLRQRCACLSPHAPSGRASRNHRPTTQRHTHPCRDKARPTSDVFLLSLFWKKNTLQVHSPHPRISTSTWSVTRPPHQNVTTVETRSSQHSTTVPASLLSPNVATKNMIKHDMVLSPTGSSQPFSVLITTAVVPSSGSTKPS